MFRWTCDAQYLRRISPGVVPTCIYPQVVVDFNVAHLCYCKVWRLLRVWRPRYGDFNLCKHASYNRVLTIIVDVTTVQGLSRRACTHRPLRIPNCAPGFSTMGAMYVHAEKRFLALLATDNVPVDLWHSIYTSVAIVLVLSTCKDTSLCGFKYFLPV